MRRNSAPQRATGIAPPDRIREITQYILNSYRLENPSPAAQLAKGFNAMFAVSSVDAAKLYYESFKELQKGKEKPLKVATHLLVCGE